MYNICNAFTTETLLGKKMKSFFLHVLITCKSLVNWISTCFMCSRSGPGLWHSGERALCNHLTDNQLLG